MIYQTEILAKELVQAMDSFKQTSRFSGSGGLTINTRNQGKRFSVTAYAKEPSSLAVG